jgi:hypothetical protein
MSVTDLTGKQFGRLLVLGREPFNKCKQSVWRCRCDCGEIRSVITQNLKDKRTTSCGCSRKVVGSEHFKWRGTGKIPRTYWSQVLRGAAARNIKVDLTIEEAWGLFQRQNETCALTGLPLRFGSRKRGIEQTASLDRRNSSKAYVLENVQWIHKTIQHIKMELGDEELIDWCKLIATYNPAGKQLRLTAPTV